MTEINIKVILKKIEDKEKEYIIVMMEKDMKVILKEIKVKERESIIIIMVIDMKVNGKIIKEKEKEYIIIAMVIEKWEIIIMISQLESMQFFVLMEKLHLNVLIK